MPPLSMPRFSNTDRIIIDIALILSLTANFTLNSLHIAHTYNPPANTEERRVQIFVTVIKRRKRGLVFT